jgi:hypothetical protein
MEKSCGMALAIVRRFAPSRSDVTMVPLEPA